MDDTAAVPVTAEGDPSGVSKDTRSKSLSLDYGTRDLPIRHRGIKVVNGGSIRKRAHSASNFISGAPPNEILTDVRGVVLSVTPDFLQFTGYREAEMVGRKCNFLQGAQTDPQDVQELRLAMQDHSQTSVIILNYCKDGRPFWNILTIMPEFASVSGELARYHGEVIGIPVPPHMQGRPRLCLDDALALLSVYASVPRALGDRAPPRLLQNGSRATVSLFEDGVEARNPEEDKGDDADDADDDDNGEELDDEADSTDADSHPTAASSAAPLHKPVYQHQNYAGRFLQQAQQQQQQSAQGEQDPRRSGSRCSVSSAEADDVTAASRYYFVAETSLPTANGRYRVRAYRNPRRGAEPLAIIYGAVEGRRDVVVRVHDQCLTSEIFGSLKCDCKQQLDFALNFIQGKPGVATTHPPAAPDASHAAPAPAPSEGGIVLYLPQEGRGIGLANKIAAYAMQEAGLDTVDANRHLGLPDDAREYDSVRDILTDLDVRSIRLLTNNPRKISCLQALGIDISERLECVVVPNSGYSMHYVHAKAERMGHMINVGSLTSNFSRQQQQQKAEQRQWQHNQQEQESQQPARRSDEEADAAEAAAQRAEQRRLQREDIARRRKQLQQEQEELERLQHDLESSDL